MFFNRYLVIIAAWTMFTCSAADEDVMRITRPGVPLVPISISGYTGEANQVLRFDLEVAGFEISDSKATYDLTGRNENNQVEGRLTDKLGKASLLAKAYTGGTTRSQAHALADEIVSVVLKVKGVARTKVFYKQEVG